MSDPLLDREFLEKLERLTLQWQKSFHGLVGGHNPSRFAGPGQEFLDHRNFHSGDDLRAVNWRAYMRFEKFFLKTFQVEPRVPVRLLLDTSASMGAADPSGAASKFDYARRLAAALTYIGLVRVDTILIQPFASRLLEPYLCSGGRHRFQGAERFLRSLTAQGETLLPECLREYLSAYPQRGLAIVISDFLASGTGFRALQHLADFGHELLLVQVWTPEDRVPSGTGEFDLLDIESRVHRTVTLDDRARGAYTTAFDAYAQEISRLALRHGGRYAGFSTEVAVEEAIFGPLTAVATLA